MLDQRRRLNLVPSVLIVLLSGLASGACTGGGGCGCDMQPLPGGELPADQTIEGGGQVRVTPTGFQKLTAIVPGIINDALEDGFCIPRQGPWDVVVADVQA